VGCCQNRIHFADNRLKPVGTDRVKSTRDNDITTISDIPAPPVASKFFSLYQSFIAFINLIKLNIHPRQIFQNTQLVLRNQGFLRYFRNTTWLFSEQVLRMVAGLLVGIWVARYLGPYFFGIYSYSVAFVALFGTLAKLGLDNIVVRDIVNYPDKTAETIGTAFWLKVGGGLTTICTILAAVVFIEDDPKTGLFIMIVAAGLFFQSFEVVNFYFQAQVLGKYIAACKMVQLMVSSLLKLFLIIIQAELIFFVAVILVDEISLAAMYGFIYSKRRPGKFWQPFHLPTAKRLLKDSWPLLFASFAVVIYMRIDQVMIKALLGQREVGLYSVAVKLSEVWYFVPTIITTSLFPAILNAKKQSDDLYYRRLKQLYALLIWLGIIVALPVSLSAERIVVILYGSAFSQSGSVLTILVWAGIAVGLMVSSGRFLIAENLTKYTLERNLMGALLNVGLNLLLIPKFGIKGAASSSVFAFFFSGLLYDLLKPRLVHMFFMKTGSIFILWDRAKHQ
jgi:O-antigen/teichoic acid export membrane protein